MKENIKFSRDIIIPESPGNGMTLIKFHGLPAYIPASENETQGGGPAWTPAQRRALVVLQEKRMKFGEELFIEKKKQGEVDRKLSRRQLQRFPKGFKTVVFDDEEYKRLRNKVDNEVNTRSKGCGKLRQ